MSKRRDTFDRTIAAIDGLPGVDQSRPSTVTTVAPILSTAQTYIVQTYTSPDGGGFIAFVQMIEANRSVRIVLPEAVTAAIYRQREALIAKGRRRRGRDRWEQMDPDQKEAAVTRLRGSRKSA